MRAPLVAIAILIAPHAAAQPAPSERAAVVAIDLDPGAPAYLRTKAASQVEAGLTAAGYEVMPATEVEARLAGELATCREGACVRRVGEALGVRSLVFVMLGGADENTIITLRLHDAGTGDREAEVRDVCDLCGEAELGGRLGIAASALRARALEVRQHRLEQARRTTPTPTPTPTPVRPIATAPPSIAPGILVAVAGAIAVGGGLYLVAIDGRGTCARGDGPVYPAPGAVIRYPDPSNMDDFVCREVYKTKALGFGSAGLGVAAVAAGVVLIVRARQHEPALEIAPRPGGAAVKVSWWW